MAYYASTDTVPALALAIEVLYATEDAVAAEKQVTDTILSAVADQRYPLEERLAMTDARDLPEFQRKAGLLVRSSEHQTEMAKAWSDGLIADAIRIFREVRP